MTSDATDPVIDERGDDIHLHILGGPIGQLPRHIEGINISVGVHGPPVIGKEPRIEGQGRAVDKAKWPVSMGTQVSQYMGPPVVGGSLLLFGLGAFWRFFHQDLGAGGGLGQRLRRRSQGQPSQEASQNDQDRTVLRVIPLTIK